MENITKPKARVKHLDRVSLSPKAVTRLNDWMVAIEANTNGIRLTRNDLISFIVLGHSSELSEAELVQLREQYFDEVRFAEWAIRQLKNAKAAGTHLTLEQIMSGTPLKKEKKQ